MVAYAGFDSAEYRMQFQYRGRPPRREGLPPLPATLGLPCTTCVPIARVRHDQLVPPTPPVRVAFAVIGMTNVALSQVGQSPQVKAIRDATQERRANWTEAELLAVPAGD